MRHLDLTTVSLAALLLTSPTGFAPAAAGATLVLSNGDTEPDLPSPSQSFGHGPSVLNPIVPGSPWHPAFGLDGAARTSPAVSGKTDAAAEPEPAQKPPTRAEVLDKLLGRLAKATDPDEAQGIAGLIEQIWMKSGSDTADLLMTRVVAAINNNRHDVADALLDQIIELQPNWAEAWNKRATLRFLDNDDAGSMEDISHVLALEPRHFGAISGMGFILERHGEDKAALTTLRRALEIYPENPDVRKAVDKLTPEVEGHDL